MKEMKAALIIGAGSSDHFETKVPPQGRTMILLLFDQ
jgi:hypothetical protein